MPAGPVQTLRIAAGAARRALVRDLLFAAGRGLGVTCGIALLAIGAGKLGVRVPAWPVVLGAAAGAALLGAGMWAIARRWTVMRSAEELDRRLDLKNRLSTAVALARGKPRSSDPFTEWAIVDAERIAPTVRLAQAVPVRVDWTWSLWPFLAAAAVGVAMFVPVRPTHSPGLRPEPSFAERAQAAAQVRQTADAIRQGLGEQRVQGATQEQLKALAELERELSQGRVDPEQGTVHAAKQVEDMAKRLESDAVAAQKKADAMREQMARAAANRDGAAGPSTPLMDAIQRGDIKTAAEELAKAASNEPKLTSKEREELARDMEELARAIEADKREADPMDIKPAADQPPGEQSTPNADQPKPKDPPSAEERTQANPKRDGSAQDKPVDQPKPAASSETEQPASPPQKPGEREKLREALREAARELREEPKPPDSSGDTQSKRGLSDEQRDQKGPFQSRQPKDGSPPQGEKVATGGQKKEEQEAPQGQQPDGQPSQDKGQDGAREQSAPKDGKGEPQSQPGATGQEPKRKTTKAEPADQQPGDSKPAANPGEHGESRQPASHGAQDQKQPAVSQRREPSGQPGSTGSTGPTGPSSGDGSQAKPTPHEGSPSLTASPNGQPKGNAPETGDKTPSSLERAAREFKRLSDGSAQSDKERVRQLHEMARKMLEQSTPEQREQYRKLADEFAREHGDGEPGSEPAPLTMRSPPSVRDGPVSPVDARRPATVSGNDKPPERTVAQWYSDKPVEPGQRATVPAEAIRQAAEGAERAIENQQVPGRYQELVRRVFRRYSEQVPPK